MKLIDFVQTIIESGDRKQQETFLNKIKNNSKIFGVIDFDPLEALEAMEILKKWR